MFRWGVYVGLGVLAVALVTISVYNTRGILIEVLIALFIAVSLDPAVRRLNRWGVRRGWAVVVILLITTGIVVGFLVSVIPSMVHQFQVLIHDFPGYVKTLQERSPSFRRFSDRYHLTTKIEDLLASLPGKISTGAITVTRRLFGAAVLRADRAGPDHLLHGRPPPAAAVGRAAVPEGAPRGGGQDHRRDGGQGRRLHDRQPGDLPLRRARDVRHLHRAGVAVRRAGGLRGGACST